MLSELAVSVAWLSSWYTGGELIEVSAALVGENGDEIRPASRVMQ